MLRLTYMGTLMIVTVSSGHNLQQQGLRLSSAASENEYATAIADFTDEVILVPRASRDENHSGKSSTRRIQSSDPSDHYFCGIGFADASSSCAYPCPSGSKSEWDICSFDYLCCYEAGRNITQSILSTNSPLILLISHLNHWLDVLLVIYATSIPPATFMIFRQNKIHLLNKVHRCPCHYQYPVPLRQRSGQRTIPDCHHSVGTIGRMPVNLARCGAPTGTMIFVRTVSARNLCCLSCLRESNSNSSLNALFRHTTIILLKGKVASLIHFASTPGLQQIVLHIRIRLDRPLCSELFLSWERLLEKLQSSWFFD